MTQMQRTRSRGRLARLGRRSHAHSGSNGRIADQFAPDFVVPGFAVLKARAVALPSNPARERTYGFSIQR